MTRGRKYVALAATACAVLAGCSAKTPKGQVLAIVNGQEITAQDLASEARARKVAGKVNQQALLQEVVARSLLAQDAHARGLDKYSGYPADAKRLQQTFLADKDIASDIKPPAPPSDAQVKSFIEANPNAFAQRQRFQVEMIRYQPGSALNAIGDPESLQAATAKLKSLNVNYDQAKQILDSETLPAQLTQRLAATPNGQYVQLKDGAVVVGMVVDARAPVPSTPEQQMGLARQAMIRGAAERQVRGVVDVLRGKAKIAYQAGFAPPAVAPSPAAK